MVKGKMKELFVGMNSNVHLVIGENVIEDDQIMEIIFI